MSSNRLIQKQRIYQAKDALLFSVAPAQPVVGPISDVAEFQVTTPSARIALKLSFIWWQPVTGQPSAIPKYFDATISNRFASGLFVATADVDETGGFRPTANVVGLEGPTILHTYQTVPIDCPSIGVGGNTLAGWSQTFQDMQDGIIGVLKHEILSVGSIGSTHHGLNVSLRARWELVGAEMCDDEWSELRSQMSVNAPQTKIWT